MGELTVSSDSSFDARSNLTFDDLALDRPANPKIVRIHLKQSKTDQFRQGVNIFIGRTGDNLCPVTALLAYLAVRGRGPGPLFRFKDGKVLTRGRFISHIRRALDALGLVSADYAGHSFRVGAATTAAERGIPDSTIKALGRWKSSAFLRYIRTPREHLANWSVTLAQAH